MRQQLSPDVTFCKNLEYIYIIYITYKKFQGFVLCMLSWLTVNLVEQNKSQKKNFTSKKESVLSCSYKHTKLAVCYQAFGQTWFSALHKDGKNQRCGNVVLTFRMIGNGL